MSWHHSLLVIIMLWANSALAVALPNHQAIPSHHHVIAHIDTLSEQPNFNIAQHSVYKQVKYSHKLSRYSWLQDKKPKVLSYYNNLSRIVFFHPLPPVNFIGKESFLISSAEYTRNDDLDVVIQDIWTHNPPDNSHRLGGWKESNMLYKGSITYYPMFISTI